MGLPALWCSKLRVLLLSFAALASGVTLHAQGCVAAHSYQCTMDQLVSGTPVGSGSGRLHALTLDIGYRVFNSNKYFIGTQEIARPTAVRNHQNIFDVAVNYQFSPRWSFIADVPIYDGTRNQIYPPSGIFQVSGIGDITLGAQAWILRPPTEKNGNVAIRMSLKLPTGINDAQGTALYKGKTIMATADQSMQPGDGGWGFVIGTQAYKQIPLHTMTYFQGSWLFNPENTSSVYTFRSQPGQGLMSVPDQYLFRAGAAHAVPKVRRMSLSLGARWEGVPAHDLIGSSEGFRRPGYIVSLDPGLMYSYRHTTLSVNGPWALARNREPSVPELQNGTKNGDAFFADYTVIMNVSHHF